jgi:hypothetical protein
VHQPAVIQSIKSVDKNTPKIHDHVDEKPNSKITEDPVT